MLNTRKILVLCGAIFVLLIARGTSSQENDSCFEKRTQTEMNVCEADQAKKADTELNAVYTQLIAKNKSDAEFVQKLTFAQESWLKFREADLDFRYYQKDKLRACGSVYPFCRSLAFIDLTVERTKELKEMLNPQEGDVCGFASAQELDQDYQPTK